MNPQWALEEIVDAAVTGQYDGPLERLGEDKDGATHYRPEDVDRVRELLVSLWGEVLTPEAVEGAFGRLMDGGEWPHGYCEEDEEERPLSNFRTEEDEAADRLDGFKYDPALTGRDTTAALRELATIIATGGAAAALQAPTPALIDIAFPGIAATDRGRISLLLAWAMQVQHTETAVELARAQRRRAAEALATLDLETTDGSHS